MSVLLRLRVRFANQSESYYDDDHDDDDNDDHDDDDDNDDDGIESCSRSSLVRVFSKFRICSTIEDVWCERKDREIYREEQFWFMVDQDAILAKAAGVVGAADEKTFVDSYIGGKETLTLEDTKSMLLMREDRQNAESSVTESQASRLAATRSKGHRNSGKQKSNQNKRSSKSKGSRSDDICNYCKEKGHWKTECPKIKRNHKRSKRVTKGKYLPLLHKLRLILKKLRSILKEI
ncbi:uncharacterized protein LOC120084515 [Benincasa hispida]|uniref:uncharacterized protein LOC120084515 n=1 Tax=Benincasa hispida TaxID=102211 RepID=UPI0019009249|nr:uncharacterized protein LOC120084515 [Benincasa hispida]